MKKLIIVYTIFLPLFTAHLVQAQTLDHSVGDTVADSLMEAWIQMWNKDDVDAVADIYAEDVVLHADTLSSGLVGKDAVFEATKQRMLNTGNLSIKPDHSFEQKDIAYQTGRFMINGETGAYSFIFHHTENGWKLRSTYYLHDAIVTQ